MQTQKQWFDAQLKKCGRSARSVAKAIDVDPGSFHNLMTGKRQTKVTECFWIAKELEVDPGVLCEKLAAWDMLK